MSSTIHSLGPKSANGLSCEVCCVDTAALVLFTGAPGRGFRLRASACTWSIGFVRCLGSPDRLMFVVVHDQYSGAAGDDPCGQPGTGRSPVVHEPHRSTSTRRQVSVLHKGT